MVTRISEHVRPHFVIHEHHALRAGLHHDLRLEITGVLESWAVPKGVPTSADQGRRLAIKMPDHPLTYIEFEGDITEGYGKGTVEIWDEGEYVPIQSKPNLRWIQLRGERARGNYYLRHWRGNHWLIWKQA